MDGPAPRAEPVFNRRVLWIGGAVAFVALFVASRFVPTPPPPIPDPQLISSNGSYDAGVYTETGTIENRGHGPTDDVLVRVTVYDGATSIGSGQQDLGALKAGQREFYTIAVTLSRAPDQIRTETSWTWQADQCPPGSKPSPDASDSSAQWCPGPSSSPAAA